MIRAKTEQEGGVASTPSRHDVIAEWNQRVVDLQAHGELKVGLAEAVKAERFAAKWLARSDVERAKAICNLGYLQQQTGARPAALRTYRRAVAAMAEACGENSHFYSRALVLLSSLLIELKRFEEAESMLVGAVWASSHDPNRDEEKVSERLRDLSGLHEMMAKEDPIERAVGIDFTALGERVRVSQYLRNPMVGDALHEIQGYAPPRQKAAVRKLLKFLGIFAQEGDYAEALRISWRYQIQGEPFALLLRGFGPEAESRIYRSPGGRDGSGDAQVTLMARKVGEVESQLAKDFRGTLPILTVAPPEALTPGHASQGLPVPRLVLPAESWKTVVQLLVRSAHLIVVDALDVRTGLGDELEMIARAGRCDSTVVLLHRGRSMFTPSPSPLTLQARIFSRGNRDEAVAEQLTPRHPFLSRFPRVGYFDDLKAKPLATPELFGDLFVSIPMARSATRLGLAGGRLLESGHVEEARRYFWASIGAGSSLGDWSLRPAVLFNYALTCEKLGHVQDAIEAYETSRTAAEALHNEKFQGLGLLMKGSAQLNDGQRDAAFASLWASLGPLDAAGDWANLGVALEALAKAFVAAGDKAGAAAARAERRRCESVSTWHLSEAGAAFRHRAAAVIATPPVGAANPPRSDQGKRPSEPIGPTTRRTRAKQRANS